MKKILTIDDLYNFLLNQNRNFAFSSLNDGYEISVSTPGSFELKQENDDEGLFYCFVKAFHDLSNANKSFIDTKVFKERVTTMKNRPIMADIVDTDTNDKDGNPIKDFSGHTMYYDEEKDKMIYTEIPVGHVINPENIRVEYDSEYERNFAIADCVIYEEYTDTCDILRRRKKVDCSVELSIRSLSYDASNKELKLDDYYVQGITLLGSSYAPGMKGSNVSLNDFSAKNNSIYYDGSLINSITDAVIKRLSDKQVEFSTEDKTTRKEENPVDNENTNVEFEETETNEVEVKVTEAEDVDVETTEEDSTVIKVESSDETIKDEAEEFDETAEKTPNEVVEDDEITEEFGDDTTGGDDNQDEDSSEGSDENSGEDATDEHQSVSAIEDEDSTDTVRVNNTLNITLGDQKFELSLSDIQFSIETLVNEMYSESDGTYYAVIVYSESKTVVMIDTWNSGKAYRQNYKDRKGVYSLVGSRVPVRSIWVTSDEEAELDRIRSNYSSIEEQLNTYKAAELHAKREEILAAEDYSVMADFAEFTELKNNMDNYSIEDLSKEADLVYAKFMKSNYSFAGSKEAKKRSMVFMNTGIQSEEERLPYGGLFKNFKNKNK